MGNTCACCGERSSRQGSMLHGSLLSSIDVHPRPAGKVLLSIICCAVPFCQLKRDWISDVFVACNRNDVRRRKPFGRLFGGYGNPPYWLHGWRVWKPALLATCAGGCENPPYWLHVLAGMETRPGYMCWRVWKPALLATWLAGVKTRPTGCMAGGYGNPPYWLHVLAGVKTRPTGYMAGGYGNPPYWLHGWRV